MDYAFACAAFPMLAGGHGDAVFPALYIPVITAHQDFLRR